MLTDSHVVELPGVAPIGSFDTNSFELTAAEVMTQNRTNTSESINDMLQRVESLSAKARLYKFIGQIGLLTSITEVVLFANKIKSFDKGVYPIGGGVVGALSVIVGINIALSRKDEAEVLLEDKIYGRANLPSYLLYNEADSQVLSSVQRIWNMLRHRKDKEPETKPIFAILSDDGL